MSVTITDEQIRDMSVETRLTLIERLWDSVVQDEVLLLSDELREELRWRWAAYKADPTNVLAWEAIRSRLTVSR
jgi:putative addiction module component (TIGR02574 family)